MDDKIHILLKDNQFEYRKGGYVSKNQVYGKSGNFVQLSSGICIMGYEIQHLNLGQIDLNKDTPVTITRNINTLTYLYVYVHLFVEMIPDNFMDIDVDTKVYVNINGHETIFTLMPQDITTDQIFIPFRLGNTTTLTITFGSSIDMQMNVKVDQILFMINE